MEFELREWVFGVYFFSHGTASCERTIRIIAGSWQVAESSLLELSTEMEADLVPSSLRKMGRRELCFK